MRVLGKSLSQMSVQLLVFNLLASSLAPLAQADVCQKGAENYRLKIATLENGRMQFMTCTGHKPCVPFGPKGFTFTTDEIARGRDDLHARIAGSKAGETAGDIMTLFFFVVVQPGLTTEAAKNANAEKRKKEWLQQEYKTIAPELITSDSACHDVASITNHRAALLAALQDVAKANAVPTDKPANPSDARLDADAGRKVATSPVTIPATVPTQSSKPAVGAN